MSTEIETRATLGDLSRVEGKAELIGGRIARGMPTGFEPGRVAMRIARSLADYEEASGEGWALGDNVGYSVPELGSGRESFSPDASYYVGPLPANPMRFVEGPPTFAVEVRSEGDRGPGAEAALAAKRADYFEAGTLVVWDVDVESRLVRSYRAEAALEPREFRAGELADAEPALPGWRLEVDRIFI